MKLKLTNEQKLILSQKMQQSLKLLQMNSHELETYLNELSMENPLYRGRSTARNAAKPRKAVFRAHDDGSGHNVAHGKEQVHILPLGCVLPC